MTVLSEQELDALRERYGRILAYEVGDGSVVFRKPSRAEYMRFVDELSDERMKRSTSLYALVRACCVVPAEPGAQEAVFEDSPGLIVQAGADLQQLAGAGAPAVKKGG